MTPVPGVPTVVVRNVSKAFPASGGLSALARRPSAGSRSTALVELSFDAHAGEILAVLGPNGAGKTTLVEILATLLSPTSGTAHICGHDVVTEAADVRTCIGYCPADSETLYPRLSGVENLEFFAALQDLPTSLGRTRIAALLDLVGLVDAGRVRVDRYSDGMKARLSLARALLTDPQVLLLDEPTRALDPVLQVEFQHFVRQTLVAERGKTVLWVTHSLVELEELCDRVLILVSGRLAAIGTAPDVRRLVGASDLATAFARAVAEG